MDRALARMGVEPEIDTIEMESAETLQAAHVDADLEFLETDRALGIIDTVLLSGLVGEETGAAG